MNGLPDDMAIGKPYTTLVPPTGPTYVCGCVCRDACVLTHKCPAVLRVPTSISVPLKVPDNMPFFVAVCRKIEVVVFYGE
jgi:hypothetical protein